MTEKGEGSGTVDLYEGSPGADSDSTWVEEVDLDDVNTDGIDTSNLEQGDYYLDGGSGEFEFTVREHTLTTKFNEDTVRQSGTVDLNIDSNRGTFDSEVSAEGLSQDELLSLFGEAASTPEGDHSDADYVIVENRGDFSLDFSQTTEDVGTGNYTFTVESVDTTASDNATIEVQDDPDTSISFTQDDFTGQIGNEVSFNLSVEGTDAPIYVNVGDKSEVNFEQNLSITGLDDVESGEEVQVTYNTFHAPSAPNAWSSPNDGVTVNVEDTGMAIDQPLGPYGYELGVSTGYDADADEYNTDQEQDLAFLQLSERTSFNESSLQTVTAPKGAVSGADSLEEATLTETGTIANGDQLLTTVSAESVYAFVNDSTGYVHGADAGGDAGVQGMQVKVVQDISGPNTDDSTKEWITGVGGGLSAQIVSVDEENETFTVLLTTTGDKGELPTGEELDLTFEITDQSPYIDDAGATESSTTTFSIEERNLEWNDGADEVAAIDGSEVTGTTNVAPGTTINTRARTGGSSGFVERDTPTVQVGENGNMFTASFDLGGEEAGTEFDLSAEDNKDSKNTASITSTLVEGDTSEPAETMVEFGSSTYDVTKNDTAEVTIDVTAGADGLDDVSVPLMVNGEEVASQSTGSLGAENTTTLTFEVNTSSDAYPVGEHELSTEVDNTSASATFNIAEEDPGSDDSDTGDSDTGDSDTGDSDTGDSDTGDSDTGDSDSSDDSGGSDDSGSDGQPGFGISVAIVSLLGAALLALRKDE
ncbi:BGTF surface domain-containing protein [Natronoarchaeum rubrum]|uniref:BGTF surface domain-containing protein n=1 Tax=Natronoarchaeum rubrum TaxID=755311 RepID=UPI0021129916|nr:BGTF surface domain-containing protein [Natronoarchaeum rubrum]